MSEFEMLKERFANSTFKGKKKTIQTAIENAYADMSRRATGHNPSMKEVCVTWLVGEVFNGPLDTQDFDTWHKQICTSLAEKLNERKKGFGTVGRALKVVNMAFKYLSCISNDYDGVRQFCHMTLDGYTLAWYKDCVMPWAKKNKRQDVSKVMEWSKIDKYEDYKLMQDNIRAFLSEGAAYSVKIGAANTRYIALPSLPFEAEFIVWEGEIVRGKYMSLTKELDKYANRYRGVPAGRENDKWIIEALFDDYLRSYCTK